MLQNVVATLKDCGNNEAGSTTGVIPVIIYALQIFMLSKSLYMPLYYM